MSDQADQSPILEWRGAFANAELNQLHAEGFGHAVLDEDWWGQVNGHSLGWVCARYAGRLTGFVNVAWDGGGHAFLLDTLVAVEFRHRGLATAIVQEAAERTRAAGCEWLHVDFEPHLRDFYFGRCGFRKTDAGIMALR
jgi:GNAT superfamily N-acetyltransferase